MQSLSHIVIGGGLAGGLTALALADARRGDAVALVERHGSLGGNHTWSFHESDLDEDERSLVIPLVSNRWPRQSVRFPGYERTLGTGYLSISSGRYDALLRERLERAGVRLLLGEEVVEADARRVRLSSGAVLRADVVLDARGPAPLHPGGRGTAPHAYQKFVGLELDLASDGPWEWPVVMDATVAQLGGLRFVYVLPFSRRHVLVEDTVYADGPALDVGAFRARALEFARAHGARPRRVLREETGVLPLPLDATASPSTDAARADGPLAIGWRGGFFHPVTGYSLPIAARVARIVAEFEGREATTEALEALHRQLEPQRRFERRIVWLMFSGMSPETRWRALERFYRLPDDAIERFYASRNTFWDRARVLIGRPPAGFSWRAALDGARRAA